MDSIKLVKPASPKKIFNLDQHKQYFKEALETFSKLGSHGSMDLVQPSKEGEYMISTGTPIEEWFRMFLKIVNNGQMLEHLKKNLNMVVQGGAGHEDSGKTGPFGKYIRRVKRNKRRIGK